jgi:hypothetical protein
MAKQIFISYSRPDDERFGKNAHGWVTAFADNLRKALRHQRGGRAFEVWMDHQLQPEKSLTTALSAELHKASALLAMLSPTYLDSAWCKGELDGFVGRFGGRHDERVFLAEFLPDDWAELHPAVHGLVPRRFWERGIDQSAPMTLGFPTPDDADRLYWNELRELAHAIGRRLARDEGAEQGAAPPKVWIASPTDDQRNKVVELSGYLRQMGCELVQTEAVLFTPRGADAEAQLKAALGNVDLMVQLYGPHAGRVFDDIGESVTALQWRVAQQVSQSNGRPLLAWRSPDLVLDQLDDAAYRQLVTGSMACGFEEFKRQLAAALGLGQGTNGQAAPGAAANAAGPAAAASQHAADPNAPPLICVSADAVDQPLGHQVLQMLGDLGADATLAPEPGPHITPDAWRSHYEQALVDSDALLIVYGQTQPFWVQSRLSASRRMLANRRATTFSGVLEAPPSAKQALGMQLRNLSLLDCRHGLQPGPLQHFLAQVKAGAGNASAAGAPGRV